MSIAEGTDGSVALPAKIGPGRFVAVVGPSGAGKDTLIGLARQALADEASVMFARRVVTREGSVAEDHESVTEADFSRKVAAGAFAVWWRAHGLCYGVPLAVDAEVGAGRSVVVNVSRAVVPVLRERYGRLAVVLVTAPADVLAARLAARGRPADGSLEARLKRLPAGTEDLAPDLVIENVGAPADSAAKLIALLRDGAAAAR